MVPWAGLRYLIVVFPDHTHLRFVPIIIYRYPLGKQLCTKDI